jgi:hypothetical protein
MTATYVNEVIEQVRAWDAARERSMQKEVGWSDMAGCRAYMGFKVREEWASDDEETWRAVAGTALHAWLSNIRAFALFALDEEAAFDWEVTYKGVTGHIDEVTYEPLTVTDYKFPSVRSARLWDDPDTLEEKFIQVQGYAAGLLEQHPAADDDVTVRLLVCPVDGKFDDWRCYDRPFDREAADTAIIRYEYVKTAVATGEDLPKDKPYWWCERFCEFFSACRDPQDAEKMAEITDPELATAVERYGLARELHSDAESTMKELAPLIKGLYGTARGWKIRMSRAGAGKMVVDEDEMIRHYRDEGLRLPMRPVSGRPASLLVSREKK